MRIFFFIVPNSRFWRELNKAPVRSKAKDDFCLAEAQTIFSILVITTPQMNGQGTHTVGSGLLEPFGCADKSAEKYCWLICCERKILFRLKKQAEKTDYKLNDHLFR
jgi:hypothetical protein